MGLKGLFIQDVLFMDIELRWDSPRLRYNLAMDVLLRDSWKESSPNVELSR